MELTDKNNEKGKMQKNDSRVEPTARPGAWKKWLTVGGLAASLAIAGASCSEVPKDENIPIPGLDGGADAQTDHDGGDADGGSKPDGGIIDAGPDADGGQEADAGTDAGPVTDGGVDQDGGPITDGGVDQDGGPVTDGGADQDSGVTDGGVISDGGSDAGLVACSLATTGSMNGYINKIHPTIVGGYSFLYVGMEMPDGSSDAVSATLSIVCGAESVNPSLVCPIGIDKQFDVPKDGMKITVNAVEAGAGSVYVHLRVESL